MYLIQGKSQSDLTYNDIRDLFMKIFQALRLNYLLILQLIVKQIIKQKKLRKQRMKYYQLVQM